MSADVQLSHWSPHVLICTCAPSQVLMPLLEGFQANVVHLPLDSIPRENWGCALKREPSLGCMTTTEAVARCALVPTAAAIRQQLLSTHLAFHVWKHDEQ